MPQTPLKILFVINVGAGRKKGIDWKKEIDLYFEQLPHHIRFFNLPDKAAKEKLKKLISDFYPQKVVAVGGDGTIGFVAKLLVGKKIDLGILPAGSANGMAKELNIPKLPKEALDIVMHSEACLTDLVRLNDNIHCLHLADVGVNAQMVKYFEEGPTRGNIGYALALIKTLFNKERIKVSIQTKDQLIRRTAMLVIIANASKYGSGAVINPKGDIRDGLFEVIIVRKIAIAEILRMFLKVQNFNPKHIEICSANSVLIETAGTAHFQVDGEYLGKVRQVAAHIVPGAIRILMPESTRL